MTWLVYPLSKLAHRFVSGGTPDTRNSNYWNGEIPWITGADIVDGAVTIGRRYINKLAVEKSATNIVPKGSILLVTRTSVGKLALAPTDIAISQDITGVILKKGLNASYITAAIKSQIDLLLKAQRGATIKGVTREDVIRLPIPFPAPSEQNLIVEILEKLEALRKRRTISDMNVEHLLPALFHHLFGDPIRNTKHWPVLPLSTFFTHPRHGARCGPFGSALKKHEYTDTGVPVWGIDNVLSNKFIEHDSLFIPEDKYIKLASYSVIPGDILISRAGTVGRMCVAQPSVTQSIIGTNLIRLAFDIEALHPEYFSAMFTYFPQLVSRFRAASDRGAYSFMNTSVLRPLHIPVPPTTLQLTFAQYVSVVRAVQRKQSAGGYHIGHLYETLLQMAFTGSLTQRWREAHMKELLPELESQAKLLESKIQVLL